MKASLQANDGHSCLTIRFVTQTEYAADSGFDSSIHLAGQHWDGDHTHPVSTSIDGFWLRGLDLTALRDHITDWTMLPLDQLHPEKLNGEFELARLPKQKLLVTFGAREDTISHLNPVVSICFSANSLSGDFHFVTDQSCLASFAQELPR